MKKLLIASSLFFMLATVGLFFAPVVQAVDPFGTVCEGSAADSPACGSSQPGNPNPITGPDGVLTIAIEIVSTVAGVMAVFVMIVAGFRYVTSSGDPATVNAAKNTILFASIGVVVAIFARTILVFVLGKL